MDSLIRNVLARYYEDPQDSIDPTRDNLPFLDYLKKKAPLTDTKQPSGDAPGGCSYNPYDYQDPSSAPKNIEDSPEVFVKDIPTHPIYTRPEVFEEDKSLNQWQKARRQDWTQPPSEQMPLMSITRRHAAVKSSLVRSVISKFNGTVSLTDIIPHKPREMVATSFDRVLNKDFHYKNNEKLQRAGSVTVSQENTANEKEKRQGKFIFRTSSTSGNQPHTTILQFYQADEGAGTAARYIDLPVKLSCSCQSFLWYGAQWYAVKEKYMYLPALRKSVMPPTPHTQVSRVSRGKGLNFRVCKHLLAVYNHIASWRLQTEYKTLTKIPPLSKIMNPDQFEKFFNIPFSYNDIKEALQNSKPWTKKIEGFFTSKTNLHRQRNKRALGTFNRWFIEKYSKMGYPQKVQAMQAYVQHPEQIFYLMVRDAALNNGKISDDYIKEGVELMSNVIDPQYGAEIRKGNLDAIPGETEAKQEGLEDVPEEQKDDSSGTDFASPEDVEQYTQDEEEEEKSSSLW